MNLKICLYALVMSLLPVAAQADLRVFACEPEWASLVEALGAGHVETTSATNALQDPHYIQARPSLISAVRKADLLICSGADLEIGWLPKLLEKGNNPAVRPGAAGYFEASSFVRRLDVPESVDRAQGDMHPQGNPHVQTHPHNITLIAQALGERMAQLDPDSAAEYRAATRDFLSRWATALADWEKRAEPLHGRRIVTHHKSWVYLETWLGLQEVGTLEPVPGVPPTAGHLSKLVEQLGEGGQGADFIVRSPYQADKASLWLSERTGIPALVLPLTVGGTDGATDLFGLFDDILARLLNALEH